MKPNQKLISQIRKAWQQDNAYILVGDSSFLCLEQAIHLIEVTIHKRALILTGAIKDTEYLTTSLPRHTIHYSQEGIPHPLSQESMELNKLKTGILFCDSRVFFGNTYWKATVLEWLAKDSNPVVIIENDNPAQEIQAEKARSLYVYTTHENDIYPLEEKKDQFTYVPNRIVTTKDFTNDPYYPHHDSPVFPTTKHRKHLPLSNKRFKHITHHQQQAALQYLIDQKHAYVLQQKPYVFEARALVVNVSPAKKQLHDQIVNIFRQLDDPSQQCAIALQWPRIHLALLGEALIEQLEKDIACNLFPVIHTDPQDGDVLTHTFESLKKLFQEPEEETDHASMLSIYMKKIGRLKHLQLKTLGQQLQDHFFQRLRIPQARTQDLAPYQIMIQSIRRHEEPYRMIFGSQEQERETPVQPPYPPEIDPTRIRHYLLPYRSFPTQDLAFHCEHAPDFRGGYTRSTMGYQHPNKGTVIVPVSDIPQDRIRVEHVRNSLRKNYSPHERFHFPLRKVEIHLNEDLQNLPDPDSTAWAFTGDPDLEQKPYAMQVQAITAWDKAYQEHAQYNTGSNDEPAIHQGKLALEKWPVTIHLLQSRQNWSLTNMRRPSPYSSKDIHYKDQMFNNPYNLHGDPNGEKITWATCKSHLMNTLSILSHQNELKLRQAGDNVKLELPYTGHDLVFTPEGLCFQKNSKPTKNFKPINNSLFETYRLTKGSSRNTFVQDNQKETDYVPNAQAYNWCEKTQQGFYYQETNDPKIPARTLNQAPPWLLQSRPVSDPRFAGKLSSPMIVVTGDLDAVASYLPEIWNIQEFVYVTETNPQRRTLHGAVLSLLELIDLTMKQKKIQTNS